MPPALRPSADDVVKMLAANVHIGTKNLEPQMARYSFKRRSDGVYVMNLASFWEKLTLAARIIVAIENPADVCVISARPFGTRSIFKFHPSYALRPRALNLKNCGHLARNTGGMMGRRERLRSRPRKEEEEEECVGGSY